MLKIGVIVMVIMISLIITSSHDIEFKSDDHKANFPAHEDPHQRREDEKEEVYILTDDSLDQSTNSFC